MTFKKLAQYFAAIEKTKSRLEITRLLAELFKKIKNEEIGPVLYLLQGRVAPYFVKSEFGLGEKMLIKAIVGGLNVDRKTFIRAYKKIGDLGNAVEQFRRDVKTLEEEDFSVGKVFTLLQKITTASGAGSQETKTGLISQLIRVLDPLSCRYLVRIPVATLRLGFSDMTILDAFSWMIAGDKSLRESIEKGYHVRPDLGFIGTVLKQKGVKGLKHIEPTIFTPILMMRAERLSSASEIIEKIGRCAVESKYDGLRLQIHYRKLKIAENKIRLFSRNLDDVTAMYPDLVHGIKKQVVADTLICEGEAVGFNPKTGESLPFQETVQRKRKYDIDAKAKEVPLKLFVFDLLYKDGQSFLDNPFVTRRNLLTHAFKTTSRRDSNVILMASDIVVDTPGKLEALFEAAVAKGLEGIIAKKLDGSYKAGARGWNWIKYKKSYSTKLTDTVDCLIMGYDTGRGKRTGFGVGAFLVGVYDEKRDVFVTVSKIGTGLTDEEWRTLKVKSQRAKVTTKPKNYDVDKNMECDMWLASAIVVEIRADEITRSPTHTAGRVMKPTKTGKGEEVDMPGFALRFPRLERFREDKRPEEITTVHEINQMYKAQFK